MSQTRLGLSYLRSRSFALKIADSLSHSTKWVFLMQIFPCHYWLAKIKKYFQKCPCQNFQLQFQKPLFRMSRRATSRPISTRGYSGRSSKKNRNETCTMEIFDRRIEKLRWTKVEMVSTFRLTILFAEFFDQSNHRISPASFEFYLGKQEFLSAFSQLNQTMWRSKQHFRRKF